MTGFTGGKMKAKRIIPCLDIKDGRVVKGVKFLNLADAGSPEERAAFYCKAGADEVAFYDITASIEGRSIFLDLLRRIVDRVNIPVIAGGGLATLKDCEQALAAGAGKLSINTGAIKNPDLVKEASKRFGSEKILVSIDTKKTGDRYTIYLRGGRQDSGIDTIEWVKKMESFGAGEIMVNSIETDGVRGGYNLEVLRLVTEAINIPVIASGGAGTIEDFVEVFKEIPKIDAALGASVFHFDLIDIRELKSRLAAEGIPVKESNV